MVLRLQFQWVLFLLLLGSDTGGSIRQPASFCNLVGLKATRGSVSRQGLIALSSSLDIIGPLAKTTEDVQKTFEIIKTDGSDEVNSYDSTIYEYEKHKSQNSKGVIGVLKDLKVFNINKDVLEEYKMTVLKLKSSGIEIKEIEIKELEKAIAIYYIIQPAEASSNLSRFDGMRYGKKIEGDDLWSEYLNTRSECFGDEIKRRIVMELLFCLSAIMMHII